MAFQVKITKATRMKCAASIQVEGLSGKGKSGTALLLALALADNNVDDLIAVDTEKKSFDTKLDVNAIQYHKEHSVFYTYHTYLVL